MAFRLNVTDDVEEWIWQASGCLWIAIHAKVVDAATLGTVTLHARWVEYSVAKTWTKVINTTLLDQEYDWNFPIDLDTDEYAYFSISTASVVGTFAVDLVQSEMGLPQRP